MNMTPEVRNIYKIMWESAPKEQFLLFSTIFYYLFLDFRVKTGTRISLRYKRLFEISEFEITRVDCNIFYYTCLIKTFHIFHRDKDAFLHFTSPGRPTDIGLHLGKACYPCSR